MQGITITYNGSVLSPTPLINYTHVPVDLGYVYGYNTEISLDGFYSGITTTGAAISYLTGVFANQFGILNVSGTGALIYSWSGVTVDSVNFETNQYYIGSFVRYSVKLKSFDIPSGVLEPSNEYAFIQNEDGTVNVNHKISARGVRNVTGAFNQAVAFVQQFSGQDPFKYCAPLLVPSGSGCLLSIKEVINRSESVYEVNEVYKYTTGQFVPYSRVTSLNVNDSIDSEYRIIDYSVKFQGSPVTKNAQSIINSLNYNMLSDIQNDFGLDTSSWIKNSYAANIDSGSAIIDIKVGYSSGASATGYFDYEVTCEKDYINNSENWKINGEFKCFGPLDYRISQLNLFQSNYNNNSWRNYLTGLIVSTPIFTDNHDTLKLFSPNMKVNVDTNQNLATLKLSLIMEAGYEPVGMTDSKYTINVSPSRWIYELLPSVNIEGDYVVQDIQMQTQSKQKFVISCKTFEKSVVLPYVSGYLNNLSNVYVNSGNSTDVTAFVVDSITTTGTYDVSSFVEWLGLDGGISTGLNSLQSIGTSTSQVPLRQPGFSWGY